MLPVYLYSYKHVIPLFVHPWWSNVGFYIVPFFASPKFVFEYNRYSHVTQYKQCGIFWGILPIYYGYEHSLSHQGPLYYSTWTFTAALADILIWNTPGWSTFSLLCVIVQPKASKCRLGIMMHSYCRMSPVWLYGTFNFTEKLIAAFYQLHEI